MFENLLGNLKEKFQESQERKRLEKEEMNRMQREVDFRERQVFQEEFKKNALKIAIGRAKKDAAKKSGMQKLVALNRVKRLQEPGANNPSNFFNKFSTYTQKNLARTEENKKRTAGMREEAEKMRGEKPITPGIRKPFQPSGFGKR
ncbi:hypothetical protein LCGC14_0546150 [marine sediment metagenome]|uniref:Uncharacterized protein n=1 Tax=marine sediment metagenome TaxID=412755 RepID=A0A0F9RRE9_9ZZZZ